jgi:hypothetical protein
MNEGNHECINKTIKTTSQVPLFGETEDIIIDLSDSKNIHVTDFNRSYFELYLSFEIDLLQGVWPLFATNARPEEAGGDEDWTDWTTRPALVDLAKITYFFVGFKNATDCIKYYRITHNGRDVGPTIKDKVQIESYLYNVMKPKTDKENKANSYSLWEEVNAHNNSVCGQDLSMWDLYQQKLQGADLIRVSFPVIIGFDDILPFQNFSDFPSCVLGDFKLIIHTSPDALVWCTVDPAKSINQMCEIFPFTANADGWHLDFKRVANIIEKNNQQMNYDHRFIQVNSPGRAATNLITHRTTTGSKPDFAYFEGVDITLKPRTITTHIAQSVITGYKLNPAYISYIDKFYRNEPFVVPAEIITIDNMGMPPTANGVDTTKQLKFNHVKEMCILFPRRVSDFTVQFNPCLQNAYVSMFNHDYPDKDTDTTCARFLRNQLEATGLDTILQCTESFEQSITSPPSYLSPVRDRSLSDNTDFVFVIPLERQSANAFFFDGVDSGNDTENVTLKGTFIRDGNNIVIDNYARLHRNNQVFVNEMYNRTPPIVCLVSDTFWLFTSNNGGTVEYNTRETWTELFNRRYPQIYSRLMSEYMSKYN